MPKLILHIGHSKTGTTSIQRTLLENRALLLEAGILFPEPRPSTEVTYAHHSLQAHLMGEAHVTGGIRRHFGKTGAEIEDLSAQHWQEVKDRAAETGARQIVLSSEKLFKRAPQADLERMRLILGEVAETIDVVAYLRSPAARFLSNAQQNLKSRPDYPIWPGEAYRDVLDGYTSAGFGTLHLHAYAPEALIDGDAVRDFGLRHLGPVTDEMLIKPHRRMKRSVSAEAMALLQAYHRDPQGTMPGVAAKPDAVHRCVAQQDAALEGFSRPRLHPEAAAAVIRQTTDLGWLRATHGIVFEDVDYTSAGKGNDFSFLERFARVDDICPVDAPRRAALREAVLGALSESAAPPDRGSARGFLARLLRS